MSWTLIEKEFSPGPRTCSSMVALDNKLFLFGGGQWSEETKWTGTNDDLFCFDLEKFEWKKINAKGFKNKVFFINKREFSCCKYVLYDFYNWKMYFSVWRRENT